MGTPLTVYHMTTATRTPPHIRGGHVSPSLRVTTQIWGLSVIHFPRGKYQQHWDQIHFNDGGVRFSAGAHRGPGEHVHSKSVPRIDPRATLIELNVSTYSSNLGSDGQAAQAHFVLSRSAIPGFLSDIMSQHD